MIYPKHDKTIDIVIAGPDGSGTSTQIGFAIDYYIQKNLQVRSLMGTEIDALFHADVFNNINKYHTSFFQFDKDEHVSDFTKREFAYNAYHMVSGKRGGQDLRIASMVQNNFISYINPHKADVWVMEEPPRRTSGQINRVLEHNRLSFNSNQDQISTSMSHQAYRTDEFLRFRRILREEGKIVLRSRSEESCCYQIYNKKFLPNGIKLHHYLDLPGHKLAFANPPTDIIIACGKEDWTIKDYIDFKKSRPIRSLEDEYEKDLEYQLLVNRRYASGWIENIYAYACKRFGSKVPKFHRIDMTLGIIEIKTEIFSILEKIGGMKNDI